MYIHNSRTWTCDPVACEPFWERRGRQTPHCCAPPPPPNGELQLANDNIIRCRFIGRQVRGAIPNVKHARPRPACPAHVFAVFPRKCNALASHKLRRIQSDSGHAHAAIPGARRRGGTNTSHLQTQRKQNHKKNDNKIIAFHAGIGTLHAQAQPTHTHTFTHAMP